MISAYLIFLAFCFVFFFYLKIQEREEGGFDLENLTLIIPFRNEEMALPALLSSIAKQKSLPRQIIFVNDHSEDKSVKLIEEFIKDYNLITLLHLNNEEFGKKSALRLAIEESDTEYIQTMDADVIFAEGFFQNLKNIPSSDMISLPVIMRGNHLLTDLFSFEYNFFNAFAFLLSKLFPSSVSGANLIFRVSDGSYSKTLEKHGHIASGDDYFLLKEYRDANKKITYTNDIAVAVETSAPVSFKKYLNQRIRWLSKTNFGINYKEVILGMFIFIYIFGGFISLVLAALHLNVLIFLVIFALRVFLDLFVYLNYLSKDKKGTPILESILFQVIYPLVILVTSIGALFYKPKWKGRKIT